MLTSAHQSEFFERGFTRIVSAIQPKHISDTAANIWNLLSRIDIHKGDPKTWRKEKPKGLQSSAKDGTFDSVFGEPARTCLNALLGPGCWQQPDYWGQLILSLPTDRSWVVPNKAWHLDLPEKVENLELPGVQIFVCLEDIVESCGATVVASGTHRLVAAEILANGLPNKSASSTLRNKISQNSEWFHDLVGNDDHDTRNDKFMKQPQLEGKVPLQVHELTGNKGDIILMHPFLFHAPAPNIGPAIRIAATQRIYAC